MRTVARLAGAISLMFALPVVLVVLWWLLTRSDTSFYFPSLGRIVSAATATWTPDRILHDVVPSVARLLVGYLAATVLGVALGVLIGLRPRISATCEPVLEFFRAIPPPTLVPLLILFAGIGTTMKVIVIITGAVWPILLNTVEGVRTVDDVLRETADSYGIGGWRRLRVLTLRGASPRIMTGMRQALSIAIILTVISEMFSSSNGLGFTIVRFQRSFAIPEMWSGIILLGLIGFALALLFRLAERNVLWWYERQRAVEREKG